MSFVSTQAPTSLVLAAVVVSTIGGLVAVWLAQVVPPRMGVEDRPRPVGWWVAAVLTGAAYGWLVTRTVDSWAVLPAFLVFGTATLALALIDLDHQLIPNRVLFPGLGVSAALLVIGAIIDGGSSALLRGILGGVVYFLILLAVGLVARGGFGMGDVKLALLLGLFLGYLGWNILMLGSVLAILMGGVAAVGLLALTKKKRDAKFAYGPYLVVGAWIALIWGEELLDWYLRAS
ncbi:MAG: prepilin peptidase [bacterium]|nr:prepilin peptidase [bacterium]MCP4968291.1 prepilin peptidase [bacterium]